MVSAGRARVRMTPEEVDVFLGDCEKVQVQIGTFLGLRAVADVMTEGGGGSIVNSSSIEGLGGMPLLIAYSASKFAIRGMTKVAAMELGPKGIRVNSVHPGMIDTGMIRDHVGGTTGSPGRPLGTVAGAGPGILLSASRAGVYAHLTLVRITR